MHACMCVCNCVHDVYVHDVCGGRRCINARTSLWRSEGSFGSSSSRNSLLPYLYGFWILNLGCQTNAANTFTCSDTSPAPAFFLLLDFFISPHRLMMLLLLFRIPPCLYQKCAWQLEYGKLWSALLACLCFPQSENSHFKCDTKDRCILGPLERKCAGHLQIRTGVGSTNKRMWLLSFWVWVTALSIFSSHTHIPENLII